MKTPERRQWGRVLVFYYQLWTYFTAFSSVSIVDFELENVGWVNNQYVIQIKNIEIEHSNFAKKL